VEYRVEEEEEGVSLLAQTKSILQSFASFFQLETVHSVLGLTIKEDPEHPHSPQQDMEEDKEGNQRLHSGVRRWRIQKDLSNVPDPGSGAFLTPGSGIGFFRIQDPKSHIFESVMTIFWVKSSIILCKLGSNLFLQLFKNKII
jgi:hypothetical protein